MCVNLGIKLDYASVYHPQTNGQVERANGLIMSGIKPRLVRSLKESYKHWVKEIDSVLRGLRTTPNRSIGYTPFFMGTAQRLCYPAILFMTHLECACTKREREREADLDRQDNLDALEEERDIAKACSVFYQQQARRYQSREVRTKTYNVGELVLHLPDEREREIKHIATGTYPQPRG